MIPYQPTTADLRAAFNRAKLLHLAGWNFTRAMSVPMVRIALTNSARAHRARLESAAGNRLPHQPTLI